MEPDFSGYATKAGLKCSDGRTIMPEAFAHQDTMQVPLVWAHDHSDPELVLGHAILEHRDVSHPEGAGIYCYGFFNDGVKGQASKIMVKHKDVTSLSIYANQLIERAKSVFHGAIREVSLVMAGANPEARIDFIGVRHDDGSETVFSDEAVIFSGQPLVFKGSEDPQLVHADGVEEETVQDVYDAFSEKQREVVHIMIGAALEAVADAPPVKHSDDSDDNNESAEDAEDETDENSTDETDEVDEDENSEDETDESTEGSDDNDNNSEGDLNHQEGTDNMTRNAFDQNAAGGSATDTSKRLTHDQLVAIVKDAKANGGHFKDAVLAHAQEYGITDIEMLFPDAKALTETPEFISRRMEWVSAVLGGTKHSPFSRVKTVFADITEPEARAKGYLKGNRKKEEVFKLLKRSTSPTTIYKKQKLDRDDMLDITDINVVNWLKAEMRIMIEEELARAILVGDGRSELSEDKVKDPAGAADGAGIRSILHDDDLYAIKKELPANVSPKDSVKAIVRASDEYRGSGSPTMFISRSNLTELLLDEDKFGRPLYADRSALADKLGVSRIVTVDLFSEYQGLYAIIVSLADYTIGTDRGGELTSFEDFDIDFNQHKYLQETRLSGGLTKPFSAIVITKAEGILAVAQAPNFNGETNTITIPENEGVVYTINDELVTGDVVITEATEVNAEPATGYYLGLATTREWTYTP